MISPLVALSEIVRRERHDWAGCRDVAPEIRALELAGLVARTRVDAGGLEWRPTARGFDVLETGGATLTIVEDVLERASEMAAREMRGAA